MPNPFFRFKQFNIRQDRTVMKVCTDSCILGAWTALRLGNAASILDIGTGTGLLPLMLAQKSNAFIDTIETDPESAAQAKENIIASPWSDRIRTIEGDVRYYSFEHNYEFIISNPPFYESDLRSPAQKKNKAKHAESLTLEELLRAIRLNLRTSGGFSILLPHHRNDFFKNLAEENGYFLQEKLSLRQTPKHSPFRTICMFGNKKPDQQISDELIIKNETGKYNPAFSELMKDYYG